MTRIADCSLPPPPPFLALPGEPPVPWPSWLQSFETYLVAVGFTEVWQTKPTPSQLAHIDAPSPMDQSPGRGTEAAADTPDSVMYLKRQ